MIRLKGFIKYCLSLLSVCFHYNRKSKVLYLHDVHKEKCYAVEDCSMPLASFLKLVDTIQGFGFSIVKEITEKKNQVRLCFDDGYRGIWDCRDEFIKREIFPTIFIATTLIGKEHYLTAEEIIQLHDMGFSIQSHAVSHKPLTEFDEDHLNYELIEAKKELEQITQISVEEICFPLGYYNEIVLKQALLVYKRVFLSIPGSYWDEFENGIILRILCQKISLPSLRLSLIGGQEIFRSHIRKQHYHKNA